MNTNLNTSLQGYVSAGISIAPASVEKKRPTAGRKRLQERPSEESVIGDVDYLALSEKASSTAVPEVDNGVQIVPPSSKPRRISRNEKGTANVRNAYFGSNGGASRTICSGLAKISRLGELAAELYRTQKASSRAKCYANSAYGKYRERAYERKNACIKKICCILKDFGEWIVWGWGTDSGQPRYPWVLYIELPSIGQVSFHSKERFQGPDYTGGWDGLKYSEERIVSLCCRMYHGTRSKWKNPKCSSYASSGQKDA
jgi:hypothetical protein